jgi:hypothetical protein
MGEDRGVYRVLVGKPEGKRPWADPGIDRRIILGWIFRKWDVEVWTGLGWLRIYMPLISPNVYMPRATYSTRYYQPNNIW